MILQGLAASPSLTAREARALMPVLAARVVAEDALGEVSVLGGADASATRFDRDRAVYAALVTLSWPGLRRIGTATAVRRGGLPYIPGLLGFREAPALGQAWSELTPRPDLLLVDGHGLAHPGGLGIASLVGVLLDVPTIGVAKSLLVGAVEGHLADVPSATAPLVWKGRQIGVALRTRRGANPVYVSVGHRVSLPTALGWVRRTARGYRLPEPTRAAHEAAGQFRRVTIAGGEGSSGS